MPQAIQNVIDIAGPDWALALMCAAFAILSHSAKPRRHPGDEEPRTPLNTLAAIANLATPFLLILHVVWRGMQTNQTDALSIGAILVFAVVLAASFVGVAIGAAMKPLGRTMSVVAPWVSLVALVLAAYVSWGSVLAVVQLVLQNFTR